MSRLAILGSSGGAAFAAAYGIAVPNGLPPPCLVLTDRACGLEERAREFRLPQARIPWTGTEEFSAAVLARCRQDAISDILLFYSRRLSAPLVGTLPVYNIHPSLLPAFPGMAAESAALAAGVRMTGATLHLADFALDSGPIVAQAAAPMPPAIPLGRIAYALKVHLMLVLLDLLAQGLPILRSPTALEPLPARLPCAGGANPGLPHGRLRAAYQQWLARECPGVIFHA